MGSSAPPEEREKIPLNLTSQTTDEPDSVSFGPSHGLAVRVYHRYCFLLDLGETVDDRKPDAKPYSNVLYDRDLWRQRVEEMRLVATKVTIDKQEL
jgi:hypothetical protein